MNTTYLLGIAANAAQVMSVAVPVLLWKMANCHVPWCWRHGQHAVDGTGYKVCTKHHTLGHHRWLRNIVQNPRSK